MIPKSGKNPKQVTSYRPISLLSIIAKLLESLLLHRISIDTNIQEWVPLHQFGFREIYSMQQTHRIDYEINNYLKGKKYCTSNFLDVSRAFHKLWHSGLLFKIKQYLSISYFNLLKSYLNYKEFRVRISDSISYNFPITSGVFGPLLYVLYTSDLPTNEYTAIDTFADDSVILATHKNPITASDTLQNQLNQIHIWLKNGEMSVSDFHLTKRTIPSSLTKQHPNIINIKC